jgi:hypothetical protein
MFFILACSLSTDASLGGINFTLCLLALGLCCIYLAAKTTHCPFTIGKKLRAQSSTLSTRTTSSINSDCIRQKGGDQAASAIGVTANPCGYHGPILSGECRRYRQGLLPMERFFDEGSSQQNALFTRTDNGKLSLNKDCMCEIASGDFSLSMDERASLAE